MNFSSSAISICALCNNSFVSKQKEIVKCAQTICLKSFCKNCIESIFNDKFKKCQTLSMQGLWICYSCREQQQETIVKPKKIQHMSPDILNREIVANRDQKTEKTQQQSSSIEKEMLALSSKQSLPVFKPLEYSSNLILSQSKNLKLNSLNNQQNSTTLHSKAKLKKANHAIIKCKSIIHNKASEFQEEDNKNLYCNNACKSKKIQKQKKIKIQKLNSKKPKFAEDQHYLINSSVTRTPQSKKKIGRMFCNLQSPLSFITNSDFENCNKNLDDKKNKQKQNQMELEEQESVSTDISCVQQGCNCASSYDQLQNDISNQQSGFFEILKFLIESSDSIQQQKLVKSQYDETLNKISQNLFNFGNIFHNRQLGSGFGDSESINNNSNINTNNSHNHILFSLTSESSSQSLAF